ncbi:MAG: hypothetical protein P4L99_29925 [Chthoniobacter sp.]|nr:hypothetical protein [Chthoniobacter sp.]
MNDPMSDEDLKALFARQRAAEDERVPAFHAMRTRALAARAEDSPAMPLAWRWVWSGAVALCLALVAVFSLHHSAKAPVVAQDTLTREFAELDATLEKSLAAQRELTAWQSPTDFLLHPTHYDTNP